MNKKSILIIGSTGFIGKNVSEKLINNSNYIVTRYSSKNCKYLDYTKISKYDILIFASGIHKDSNYSNSDIFIHSKNNLRKLIYFLDKVDKVIFISSFKTSFNYKNNIVEYKTKYNFYHKDSLYGKSKILAEKIFLYFCKLKKKKYIILSPTHVIGPEKNMLSINNNQIKNIYKKNLLFYPDCNISIVDVRNISKFIEKIIISNNFDEKKIILNDKTLKYIDYLKIIKNNNFFLTVKINKNLFKIIFYFQNFLKKLRLIENQYVNESQISYLNLNPIVQTNIYKGEIPFEKTIADIKKLL